MAASVRDGASLSHAVGASEAFPGIVTGAVSVGEESGDLSRVLHEVAEENERDLDREIKAVMTLLEPLLVIVVGAMVGFIVMAMVLPICDLGNTLQV